MRRLALGVLILFVLVLSAQLSAQVRFVHEPADYNFARKAFDNPFSDTRGWTMRRYQWPLFFSGLATATGETIHRLTGLSRPVSYGAACVGEGFAPHIRAVIREPSGQRTINPRDWLYDGVVRCAPFAFTLGRSKRARILTGVAVASVLALVAPYGSP